MTKLMTSYVILDIVARFQINLHETLITVSQSACELIGTTATLLAQDQLSVWELLHGMMLPSGNDAA